VAETRCGGQQLRIWEAQLPPQDAAPASTDSAAPGSVLAADAAGIQVACGQGVLCVTRLQLAGRKPLQAGDFLKGQRLDGARFE
jgi:methionyl-tRNA formyltransferase